jgi:hypothetical protein
MDRHSEHSRFRSEGKCFIPRDDSVRHPCQVGAIVPPAGHPQASPPMNHAARWGILVLRVSSTGVQFPLQGGSYILGPGAGAKIRIPGPGIAPSHCEFLVGGSSVHGRPEVGGTRLKGAELGQARECADSLFAACAPSKRRWAGKQ